MNKGFIYNCLDNFNPREVDESLGDEYQLERCSYTQPSEDGSVFWTARADNMSPLNQMLVVTAYVEPLDNSKIRG